MRVRNQITVLATAAALTLGIGIPVVALTVKPATELVRGTVVSQVPDEHAILIHSIAGAEQFRGHSILIRVPIGQKIQTSHGPENVALLHPGQPVTARFRIGSFEAVTITATG